MASDLGDDSSGKATRVAHPKAQAVPPPLLSAALTAQESQQAPCGPAFASERPQSEASRCFQTGKRLARDAGAILGERVVLCMQDDDELLEYVSRGKEARQRQRLAKIDQATERERRVALAHRQARSLPTYPAPHLPRSYTPYAHAHAHAHAHARAHAHAHAHALFMDTCMLAACHPTQAAVRFVRSRLGCGYNTWRQHCAAAAALRATVVHAAARLQRPRQAAAWAQWSEAAAAAAAKEEAEEVEEAAEAAEAAAKEAKKRLRKGNGFSIGRLLGRRRAPPRAGVADGPRAAAAANGEGLTPVAAVKKRGGALTRLLGPRRRGVGAVAAAAAVATPDADGDGDGDGDGEVGDVGGGGTSSARALSGTHGRLASPPRPRSPLPRDGSSGASDVGGEQPVSGRDGGGNGGGEASAQEPEDDDDDDVFGACGDLPPGRQTDRQVARQRQVEVDSHGARRRRRVAPEQ